MKKTWTKKEKLIIANARIYGPLPEWDFSHDSQFRGLRDILEVSTDAIRREILRRWQRHSKSQGILIVDHKIILSKKKVRYDIELYTRNAPEHVEWLKTTAEDVISNFVF